MGSRWGNGRRARVGTRQRTQSSPHDGNERQVSDSRGSVVEMVMAVMMVVLESVSICAPPADGHVEKWLGHPGLANEVRGSHNCRRKGW